MTTMSQKPQSDDTAGGVCRSMTDAELDALVKRLENVSLQIGVPSRTILDSDVIRSAAAAITTLRAQLAEARAEIARLTDLNSTAYIDGHDAAKNEYRDEIQRLEVLNAQLLHMVGDDAVEQIEAAVAAQIEADAGICDEMHGSIWEYDAYECALSIRAQPHDRTALDAAIRAAKVEAWRKAEVAILGLATGRECQTAILALIERGATT